MLMDGLFQKQFILQEEFHIQALNPVTFACLIPPNLFIYLFIFSLSISVAGNKTGLVTTSIDYYYVSLVGLSVLPFALEKRSFVFPCAQA